MKKVYRRYVALCLMAFLFIQQIVLGDCGNNDEKVRETLNIKGWIESSLVKHVSAQSTDNTEHDWLKGMEQLNIPKALEKYKGSNQVVVAVLDTGIDYRHEDLSQNMWKNEKEIPGNGIDDDGNGYVDDVYGWDFYNNDNTISYQDEKNTAKNKQNDDHGTHCAGMIAAIAGNHLAIKDAAGQGNVKIMTVKVFDQNNAKISVKRLVSAIRYATAMGADIINIGWSGNLNSEKEEEQLKSIILESGKLFVVSAGNQGKNNDEVTTYPACFADLDNVVVVGSVKEDGTLSDFSNYGQTVHVAANGENIYSTCAGSAYSYSSGTDIAASIVTGMTALVYGTKAHVYPKAVKQLLLESCNPFTADEGKSILGGIIDAEQVVENIDRLLTDEKVPAVHDMHTDYSGNVVFNVLEQGGSRLCSMNYAKGKKNIAYFLHGMRGTRIEEASFCVEKTGKYTIFLRDYAGNESVKVIQMVVDIEAPVITAIKDQTYITFKITDKDTTVKNVRYAYGKKQLEYFKSKKGKAGKLKNNKLKIKYNKKQQFITVYAEDKAGNKRVTPFILKSVK